MTTEASKNYETSDLGLAAYLLIKGQTLTSAGRKGNKFHFVFLCSGKPSCRELALQYINSDFAKFDSALKTLKNLVN